MKKVLFVALAAVMTIAGYAQVEFEKGYFIDNSGKRVDCLIKNLDWKNNPTRFDYKESEGSESMTATIESVMEFSVDNKSKYTRFDVKIDRSRENLNMMSSDMEPEFSEEVLFLKTIVSGKATLYIYRDELLERFFYRVDSAAVEQLVYKKYKLMPNKLATSLTYMGENTLFRQQLLNDLRCEDFSNKDILNVDYTERELTRFFIAYNTCQGVESVNYEERQKKDRDVFNLAIRLGVNQSSLFVTNTDLRYNPLDFGKQSSFRLGLEAEIVMPFNRNKWSLFLEPTYQYFKSEGTYASYSVTVDYKSIQLPLGIRYYVFLNRNVKLFANFAYVIDLDFNSKLDFERLPDLYVEQNAGVAYGIGVNYHNKFMLETRYQPDRNILGIQGFWGSSYNTFSVIVGYNLF